MRKGFTMIELMVVMIIIGILSSLAIQNYVEEVALAKKNNLKSSAKINSDYNFAFFSSKGYFDDVSDSYSSTNFGSLAGTNGTKFTVSLGQTLVITTKSCGSIDGFLLEQTDSNIQFKAVFDSCTDSYPSLVEI